MKFEATFENGKLNVKIQSLLGEKEITSIEELEELADEAENLSAHIDGFMDSYNKLEQEEDEEEASVSLEDRLREIAREEVEKALENIKSKKEDPAKTAMKDILTKLYFPQLEESLSKITANLQEYKKDLM